MQKLLYVLLALIFVGNSCKKANDPIDPKELVDIETYLTSKGIAATKDARGFYYTIATPGGSAKPTLSNTVSVKYKGTLLNGNVFDQATSAVQFPLNGLIEGWKLGIPLVGKNGKITLYLPPSLAYGSAGSPPSIPGGASLIFDIDLVDFN
jgi:FKBP-type peptidyl-prolyl cis-trans isomerase FkpA